MYKIKFLIFKIKKSLKIFNNEYKDVIINPIFIQSIFRFYNANWILLCIKI